MSNTPTVIDSYDPFEEIQTGTRTDLGLVFNVRDYFVLGDADYTPAQQRALAAAIAAGDRAVLKFPAGVYNLSAKFELDGNDLVSVVGDGENQTKLIHADPSGGFLITITPHTGQVTANGAAFRDFRIDGSSFVAKGGIKVDGLSSGSLVSNVSIFMAGNANDVALQVNGIDQSLFSNLYLQAATPLYLGKASTLGAGAAGAIDHMCFADITLIGSNDTKPLIGCDVGLSIANTSFSGRQTWVGGYSAFDYNNTSATLGEIANVAFSNIRWESSGTQIASGPPVPVHGFMFRIVPNTASSQSAHISFINCYGGADGQQGIYLRRVQYVTWISTQFNGPANLPRVNLDADNSCNHMLFLGSNMGTGTNASIILGDQLIDYLALDQINTTGSNHYGIRYLCKTQTDPSYFTDKFMGMSKWARTFTIAPGATKDLPRPSVSGPARIAIDAEDAARVVTTATYGTFACNFSAGPTDIGPTSANVAAGNVGGKLCVDFSGGPNQVQIHNNLAYTVTVAVRWN